MYYNVEDYDYNIEKILSDYKLGRGWPEYRAVDVDAMEMNMGNDNDMGADNGMDNVENAPIDTRPRYDSEVGNSDDTINIDERCEMLKDNNKKYEYDMQLVKELHTQINKIMYPYVEAVFEEYEYVGSPIYDDEGINREQLAQFVDRVITVASPAFDEIQEIELEYGIDAEPGWNRNILLRAIVESLVLYHIFGVKRPKYRNVQSTYRYQDGRYDGMKIKI